MTKHEEIVDEEYFDYMQERYDNQIDEDFLINMQHDYESNHEAEDERIANL